MTMQAKCKICGTTLPASRQSRRLCANCDTSLAELAEGDEERLLPKRAKGGGLHPDKRRTRWRLWLWITVGVAALIWGAASLYGLTSEKATVAVVVVGFGLIVLGVITARLAAPVIHGETASGYSIGDAIRIMFRYCLSFPQPLLIFVGGILLALVAGLELEYHKRQANEAWKKNYRPPGAPK
jgi:hypothetical protein